MKKPLIILLIALGMLIGIPSLLHYVFYDSWIGIIGWGMGLMFVVIAGRLRKEEMIEKAKLMSEREKKLNRFLKIFLYMILIVTTILSIIRIFEGNFKTGVFLLEISLIILISNVGMP